MTTITKESFGTTKAGEAVDLITLENTNGMKVSVLSYGCVIAKILIPDHEGYTDVVLGYDSLKDYEEGSCFLGTFVGRFANRIKGSVFSLDGKTYHLEPNDGPNHLHGSYCSRVFPYCVNGDRLIFMIDSPDGEEGYPGRVSGFVTYELTDDNELIMDYEMTSDRDTVINLTNHSYFNLNGAGSRDILNHSLYMACDSFTEADMETLPTGRVLPVKGTPLDFTVAKKIGQDLFFSHEQLTKCGGYDHNFILTDKEKKLRYFATAVGDESGIRMKVSTTQPAVQFYCGIYLDGDQAAYGKGGKRYPKYGGFCLETQHYPCSPNFPQFPSTVLKSGDTYKEITVYQFDWNSHN